jgi:uncharacterized protein
LNYLIVLRPTRLGMLTEAPSAEEVAIVAQHFEYLQAQARAGKVRIAGRTTEDDARTLGLILLEATSEADARAIMSADPAVAKGVMRAELHPFRLAIDSRAVVNKKGGA